MDKLQSISLDELLKKYSNLQPSYNGDEIILCT